MKTKHILSASVLALGLAIGTPAFAQTTDSGVTESGNGSANGNLTVGDVNDLLDLLSNNGNNSDNSSQDNDGNGDNRGNGSEIIAEQYLIATNLNESMDELVDLDGEDDTDTAVGYNSGDNYVQGNAFAAFAGILNQAWNTGINANTQAASNIAAQGTVNFGSQGGGEGGGGGGDAD